LEHSEVYLRLGAGKPLRVDEKRKAHHVPGYCLACIDEEPAEAGAPQVAIDRVRTLGGLSKPGPLQAELAAQLNRNRRDRRANGQDLHSTRVSAGLLYYEAARLAPFSSREYEGSAGKAGALSRFMDTRPLETAQWTASPRELRPLLA
jgi:hypothetical protein